MDNDAELIKQTNIQKIAEDGAQIYDQIKAQYDPKNRGNFLAIDIESRDVYLGVTSAEALSLARQNHPNKIFYVVKIGFDVAETMAHSFAHKWMLMVIGEFVENAPWIKIIVAWGQSVQAPFVILDTGFTGDLQVTQKIAQELGLEITGVTKTQIANGDIIDVPVALAIAAMEEATNYIEVLISNSSPLVGISFLTKFGYKAIVDCKYHKVFLQKVL